MTCIAAIIRGEDVIGSSIAIASIDSRKMRINMPAERHLQGTASRPSATKKSRVLNPASGHRHVGTHAAVPDCNRWEPGPANGSRIARPG
jgi:hypothetical protein